MEWIKEHKKIVIIGGLVVLLLIIGISYALFKVTVEGTKEINIRGGNLSIQLEETGGNLELPGSAPIKDEEGKLGEAFTFYIQNNSQVDVNYKLKIIDDKERQKTCEDCKYIPVEDIRYELVREDLNKIDNLKENRVIDLGTLERGKENKISYELRIWIDYDAGEEANGGVFYGKVEVEGIQLYYGESNEPVLSDNMIPVVYDEDEKKWEKADTNTRWYDYDRQEWANAVVTTQDSKGTYQEAIPGTEVKMSDILQMYVWIPRYSYTIKSEDGENYYGRGGESAASPGEIDVRFIKADIKDSGSAKYKGDEVKGWFTPPGFTFGKEELPGIWVGKFETGYSSEAGTGKGVGNENLARIDEVKSNNVIIKPNVYSWRNIRVSTLDLVSRGMNDPDNIYGFDSSTIDTHAMKNSEWALIAYLTQSKYGKYGNNLYSGSNKEVYINNYNGYITGCSSGATTTASSSLTCANKYDVIEDRGSGLGQAGGGASSTGNITGIYDIAGDTWEYVMGGYNKYSGYSSRSYTIQEAQNLLGQTIESNIETWNSGYTGKCGFDNLNFEGRDWPEEKYYDFYTTDNILTACDGNPCKGYALGEVSGWYGDVHNMVYAIAPWSIRSGIHNYNSSAGVFLFSYTTGDAIVSVSFRIVLTPAS